MAARKPNDHLGARRGNRILDALPAPERDRLIAAMTLVELPVGTVLFEPGATIDAVHFPLRGVVALASPFEGGAIVEVAAIGNEGIVGVPHVARGSLAMRAITPVAGWSLRMDAAAFLDEWESPGPLRDLVQNYVQALFGQVAQAAACNRLHSNDQRLSRWLLMTHDRVGMDEFVVTRDFLGELLGSRRATVTLSAGVLQAAGLISFHSGQVVILDRKGLECVACECYAAIKMELDRVARRAAGGRTEGA